MSRSFNTDICVQIKLLRYGHNGINDERKRYVNEQCQRLLDIESLCACNVRNTCCCHEISNYVTLKYVNLKHVYTERDIDTYGTEETFRYPVCRLQKNKAYRK